MSSECHSCDCAEFVPVFLVDRSSSRSNSNRKIDSNESESDSLCADTTTKSVLYDFGPDFNEKFQRVHKKLWIVRKKNVTTLIHRDVRDC